MNDSEIKKALGGGAVFETGDPNDAFAQYFIGQSYLKMLQQAVWALETLLLNQPAVTTGIFIMPPKAAVRSCL